MMKDMMHDISKDMKNEKTIRWCLGFIMDCSDRNLIRAII